MQRFAVLLFWSAAAFALIMATTKYQIALAGKADDKLLHIIAFAALALLGALAYPGVRLMVLLLGLSAFGTLIELIQLIPSLNRTANWTDLAADIVAAAVVLGPIYPVRRMRKRAAG